MSRCDRKRIVEQKRFQFASWKQCQRCTLCFWDEQAESSRLHNHRLTLAGRQLQQHGWEYLEKKFRKFILKSVHFQQSFSQCLTVAIIFDDDTDRDSHAVIDNECFHLLHSFSLRRLTYVVFRRESWWNLDSSTWTINGNDDVDDDDFSSFISFRDTFRKSA